MPTVARCHRLHLALVAASFASAFLVVGVSSIPAGASLADAAPRAGWPRSEPGAGFKFSSPVIGDVDGDGSNDVVVGGQNGKVYAYHADGGPLPGWPATAPAAVQSSPAIGDLDRDGVNEVVVGTGPIDGAAQHGGVTIFERSGRARCSFRTSDRFGLASTGVFNSPAIGDVDGDGFNDIVFGSFDQNIYAVDRNCVRIGMFENLDSVWSAPALYDVDGDGGVEIFIGTDATAGLWNWSGGYFRSLRYEAGKLVERWQRRSEETFQSAGAIGDIDGDGRLEVVTGSGSDYCRNQGKCTVDGRRAWAFHLDDGSDVAGWPKLTTMNGHFLAAPALGDIDGDGRTDVVVGSTNYTEKDPASPGKELDGGAVDAFLGNGGHWAFRDFSAPEILSPPVIADVDGAGPSEVIFAVDGQVQVVDGSGRLVRKGIGLGPKGQWLARANAVAVGELGPGRFALATASFDPPDGNRGYVHVYDIPAPRTLPWPQYRKNALRLGADVSPPGVRRPVTPAPAPPATTTTGAPKPAVKRKTTTTTRPPATTTTAPPETTTTTAPPETTTTTLPPETTTTTLPSTAELEAAGADQKDEGGIGLAAAAVGVPVTGAAMGATVFRRRRRRRRVGPQG